MKVSVGDFRIGKEEKAAIREVLEGGRISEGEKAREFEKEFAKFVGTRYAVAVNSGTAALITGLTALKYYKKLGIRQGTNIITAPITYIATSNAIVLSGFNPVYVDVEPETFLITPENIRAYLEELDDPSACSVVLPVHLMGYACDMDEINKIAKEYGLVTFEDSAQAHGTVYNGKKTGTLSLLSDFSFYIAHNIQAGEMGALVTSDAEIWRLAKQIKAHGRMCDCPVCVRAEGRCPRVFKGEGEDNDPRFTHDMIGYNFKVVEFQVALGLCQLKKADWIIKKRQENVRYLNEHLEKYSDVLQFPAYSSNVSYLAYPIVIKKPHIISRKKMRMELEKRGIETRPLFGCIPTQQPAYSNLKNNYKDKLPNAEYVGSNAFYIGCHQYLTRENLDWVIKSFKGIIERIW